jgi:hypothetical protein
MNLTTLRKPTAIAAAYAAVGTFGALVAGPALGPSLWWLMRHQPTPPSPSVISLPVESVGRVACFPVKPDVFQATYEAVPEVTS